MANRLTLIFGKVNHSAKHAVALLYYSNQNPLIINMLKILLWVHCVPPCRVVFQPFCKPCHDAVVPTDAFVIVEDVVILSLDCNEGSFTAKQLQSRKHLYALVDGHIGVRSAMHEKDGRVNFVGIEERSMTAI